MKLFKITKNLSAEEAYEYVDIHGPSPELEDIIATSAEYSYNYANNILRNKFPAGEKAIATNSARSYLYARDVLGARFPVGEQAILTDPRRSFAYAKHIMHRRWLKAEPFIRKSNYWNDYWDDYKKHFNIK